MWLKVWTIGNGGIPSGCGFHQVPDGYDDEIIEEILENKIGPLCYSVRSINWEKVERLPDYIIDAKIKDRCHRIKGALEDLKELKIMKSSPKGDSDKLVCSKCKKEIVLRENNDICYNCKAKERYSHKEKEI